MQIVGVCYFIADEVAFMGLLEFMYSGTLHAHSLTELLNVLMVADKFDVRTCIQYCSYALQESMTTNAAMIYI